MASEIEFERFREAFAHDTGALPDGEVLGSSQQDWGAVVAILRDRGWRLTSSDGLTPLPTTEQGVEGGDFFAVWLTEGVRVNLFPGPEGVLFDIDLRELISQQAVDALADLLRKLGTGLGRDVVIREEGAGDPPIIRYTAATDRFSLS